MISLSKVAHHIWFNHPLTPKNKTAELAMEVGVGEDREEEGWKRGGKGGRTKTGGRYYREVFIK